MVFHSGVLIRLNELGIMKKLARVSSVSCGSISASVLEMNRKKLKFNDKGVFTKLTEMLINPIQKMASTSIDANSVLGGIFRRGTVAEWVASKFECFCCQPSLNSPPRLLERE